jgi:hypothetical protein
MTSDHFHDLWVTWKAEILNPDGRVAPVWWALFILGWILIAVVALWDGP